MRLVSRLCDDRKSCVMTRTARVGRTLQHPNRVLETYRSCREGNARHCTLGRRPSLGSRLLVRNFVGRVLTPTLNELSSWQQNARQQSALLFRVMIVFCEENLTQQLSTLAPALCKALAA